MHIVLAACKEGERTRLGGCSPIVSYNVYDPFFTAVAVMAIQSLFNIQQYLKNYQKMGRVVTFIALDISFSSLLLSMAAAAQFCASTLISPWSSTVETGLSANGHG